MSEHPLTYYQMRLWYLDQLEPNTSAHNMSFAYRLLGSLDVGALNKSVNSITERHQNLRAVFTKGETDPFLVIQNHVKFSIEKVSIEDIPENARESETFSILSQETERGFDLARGPMCRWLLIKLDDREHILVFTVHRIIADIRSMATIVRELMKIYSAAVSGD
ncbi:MAG: condensation domain-containing protein, partial [Syntrophaceae bacterium]|nr:condensation domain-containing protein [Syntrophaceae bacterium]